ncbi:hypothetical protein H9655_21660 [Cytobacillus sp. Sa5YUA1]|uniref:Transposase n=1 Tax=Cytobacillus stercorigallinarum TaxID=2762240 RepID=A0ABR8QVW2_9BACI|nr:hypothetical protein [Cytobacillus stercorigallinarum]MBD7939654.1 hypothetical protein [Cytobacillus stercorigallinarum]
MELPSFPSKNPHLFIFAEEDMKWFEDFIKSKEFAEALAIVWCYGTLSVDSFTVRCKNRSIVARFKELVRKTRPLRSQTAYIQSDKNKPYDQWVCSMHYMHPFVLQIKNMGWVPITYEDKPYPTGEFDDETFVKTYIKIHHALDSSYSKKIKYTRPRLRIHGTDNVLEKINNHLIGNLKIGKKKIQKINISNKTKYLQYTSKIEIPIILEYVQAQESIEKYNSLKLGYSP